MCACVRAQQGYVEATYSIVCPWTITARATATPNAVSFAQQRFPRIELSGVTTTTTGGLALRNVTFQWRVLAAPSGSAYEPRSVVTTTLANWSDPSVLTALPDGNVSSLDVSYVSTMTVVQNYYALIRPAPYDDVFAAGTQRGRSAPSLSV